MHRIESEVEEVVLPADSGDGSEESEDTETDRKSTRLNSSHDRQSRMPSSA